MKNEFLKKTTKIDEMYKYIEGYWFKDIWAVNDSIFNEYRKTSSRADIKYKKIKFIYFNYTLKIELKYFLKYRLLNKIVVLDTIIKYGNIFNKLSRFIRIYYPDLISFSEINMEKIMPQLKTFLIEKGLKFVKWYSYFLSQIVSFYKDFYDERSEFEKNIWDFKKIPGARFLKNDTHYKLYFQKIPEQFLAMVKQYMKMRASTCSHGQCDRDIRVIGSFLEYILKIHPSWKSLKLLSRKLIEGYIVNLYSIKKGNPKIVNDYLITLKVFFEYIQRAEYKCAPLKPIGTMIFKEDFPRLYKNENKIKYIPEEILIQLENNLEHLVPDCIPIVILLRATGLRISDVLNLRYDKCLNITKQGWYLCVDIEKTQVLNHKLPITNEIAILVKSLIENIKSSSTNVNNPDKLLFVNLTGKRIGLPPTARRVNKYLNKLALEKNIIDEQGNIFHFNNHAFRHTKAIELINNGMSLVHVQKWMAHASPEMTLCYAKILDTTMRKSWEESTKYGLFRIDENSNLKKIDISDIKNEDIIEWEYIRHNLDAVHMPLGYCMKPKKQECHTQLNPCLTCRNLCTTPDFIPQFEIAIKETKTVISKGISQHRQVWVEKNQLILEKYEKILEILKNGKIHHQAGKKGRESF
ncbi:MAG: tyrosine-type recombinase/integrase [Clostridiales bacterium]